MIIDSFLVEDGRARGLDRHLARFAAAVRATGLAGDEVETFLAGVPETLPREPGRWFPRLEAEAVGGGVDLRVEIRPAPAQGGPLAVAFAPDPRRSPRTKGPDLDTLAEAHVRGGDAGADEVLLLSPEGRALEGTRTGLLWWDGDVLCRVPTAGPVLPSVTVGLLADLAAAHGVETREVSPCPADLGGRETWLVNALHGVRPVGAWLDADVVPGPAREAAAWQQAWRDLAEPLPVAT